MTESITTQPIVLTIVYEADERGWLRARLPEHPEIVTCGRDRDEARAMVADALRELLLSRTVPAEGATYDAAHCEALVLSIAAGPSAGAAG